MSPVCLLIFLTALLTGCATRGPVLAPPTPERTAVELADTPFFPQRTHECGPAALATVLKASGVPVTPDELQSRVYVPGRQGSLQVEMQAAPRQYRRLAYLIGTDIQDIIEEVAAGRPVLVLHNYGLPFWPRWHYAVVIGYDTHRGRILMRSGTTARQDWSARVFMVAWNNGGRWAMVLLKPGERPVRGDRRRYMEAASAFEKSASPEDAQAVFDAAVQEWPEDPIAYIGRGTARYRERNLQAAASDYERAVNLDPKQAGARNNLAMTLLELGCVQAAWNEVSTIDTENLSGPLKNAVDDTRAQIKSKSEATPASQRCPMRP